MIMIITIVTGIFSTALEFLLYGMINSFVYSAYWITIGTIVDGIFLVNFILCFFIGYYDEPRQEVVLDCRLIAL